MKVAILLLASGVALANGRDDDPAKGAAFIGERTRVEARTEALQAARTHVLHELY